MEAGHSRRLCRLVVPSVACVHSIAGRFFLVLMFARLRFVVFLQSPRKLDMLCWVTPPDRATCLVSTYSITPALSPPKYILKTISTTIPRHFLFVKVPRHTPTTCLSAMMMQSDRPQLLRRLLWQLFGRWPDTGAAREVPDASPGQARSARRVPALSGQRQGLGEALRPSRGVHPVSANPSRRMIVFRGIRR